MNQKETCVFAYKVSGVKCSACSEYICDYRKCSFYKSKDEWELNNMDDRFPVRKEKK